MYVHVHYVDVFVYMALHKHVHVHVGRCMPMSYFINNEAHTDSRPDPQEGYM